MAESMSPFEHLEKRSKELLGKFIFPIIDSENEALVKGEPIPDPDFDSLAAFRMLSHAELEGYFETKALEVISRLDTDFKADKVLTKDFYALSYFYFCKKGHIVKGKEEVSRAELKDFAQKALGFARQFVSDNNGIKENSIVCLSSIMGFFGDEIDALLVSELNQYGKLRGDVAHDSWAHNTRTFESAEIEKKRLEEILKLIKNFYEC